MALDYHLNRGQGFSSWLEHRRDLPRWGDETNRAFGRLSTKRTGDRHRDIGTNGDYAFWRDFAATWLLALLLIGAVLATQAVNGSHQSPTARFLTSQAVHSTGATPSNDPSTNEPIECTNLDYGYQRC